MGAQRAGLQGWPGAQGSTENSKACPAAFCVMMGFESLFAFRFPPPPSLPVIAAHDLVLMQEAARAKGGHAVRALERLTHRAMAGATAGAQSSGSLPPSRLECSCRFADESNALDNPPEA